MYIIIIFPPNHNFSHFLCLYAELKQFLPLIQKYFKRKLKAWIKSCLNLYIKEKCKIVHNISFVCIFILLIHYQKRFASDRFQNFLIQKTTNEILGNLFGKTNCEKIFN